MDQRAAGGQDNRDRESGEIAAGGEVERLAAMDVVEGLGYLWPRLRELAKVLPA